MNSRFNLLLLFLFYTFLIYADEIAWQEIEDGCFYNRIKIYKNNEIADTINVLKIDPDKFYFRIFYNEKEKGWPEMYNIKEWHDKYPEAKIFINGSYYDENRRPTTAIWQDGKCINRKKGFLNKGALFFYTKEESNKEIMDLINLTQQPVDVKGENFSSAIQSMPVLISNGHIIVKKSDWQANRTVVAKDKKGYIFIVISEGSVNYKSFTLYDIAVWIVRNFPDVVIAVNLDGGYESQLSIKTEKLKYTTIGQWEINDAGDVSKPGLKIKIPVAIGFFKKTYK